MSNYTRKCSAVSKLDDIIESESDRIFTARAVASPVRIRGELKLQNVTFGYSPLSPPLIGSFSLHVMPGQRVALVGPSGSGKSTIARLVTGMFAPWSGEILIDGIARDDIERRVLTSYLSLVDQDISLFAGTIRDNLTLWDQTTTDEMLTRAARDAEILHDIEIRPGEFESAVEEDGRNFSGGQRQRLEIARSLVRDPSILILDEATSALDPLTELAVDRALRRRGCTAIVVAHRLSTIRDCDEIIMLDKGKVLERGTHDELMTLGGAYAGLIGA